MKQGIKTIQNLYGELERQRAARKDLIADTRSITVNSVNGLSMLTVATDSDKLSYRISEIAHRQIADRLAFRTNIMNACVRKILRCSTATSTAGLIPHRRNVCSVLWTVSCVLF